MHAKMLARLMIALVACVAVVSTVMLFRMRTEIRHEKALKQNVQAQAVVKPVQEQVPDLSEGIMNNILTRASVREYEKREVKQEQLLQIIRAGMAAPTAHNRQPWYFVGTRDKKVLEGLAATNKYAGMLADAGAAIVVVGSPTEAIQGEANEMWIQDCSAATQNILLAAHAMGLGAVWVGTWPLTERADDVRKLLDIPEKYVPFSIVSIGWPAGPVVPKNKFKSEKIFIDKWMNTIPAKAKAQ